MDKPERDRSWREHGGEVGEDVVRVRAPGDRIGDVDERMQGEEQSARERRRPGTLPERERAKAMVELTKDLPPRYREVIENYFKTLARSQGQ